MKNECKEYAEIAKILKAQHPDSRLYDMYNLKDA